MIDWLRSYRGLALAGLAATLLAALLPPPGVPRQLAALALLWLWPAWSWTAVLPGRPAERFSLAAGLALLFNSWLMLLVHYLPGVVPPLLPALLAAALAAAPLLGTGLPLGVGLKRPVFSPALLRRHAPLLLILLLAAFLRWTAIDFKEIQGDEGIILVRAAAALTGDDAELFLHQKGPVEILLPMVSWAVSGAGSEFWFRLPFAWAGWLALLAVYLPARRWFNRRVALLAAALMAVMGFGVAFSRIIQYQSLVMLWGGLALLAATRYRQERRSLDLLLAAIFLAGALLAHYDAVLVAPAVAWLVLTPVAANRPLRWRPWAGAFLAGLAILGLFYIPFALNPNFASTIDYLLNERVATDASQSAAGWSLPVVWQMITFYNSLWYVLGLLLLTLAGLWLLWQRRGPLAAGLHFLVPALFYTLVVGDPRTHVYTFFPGAIILAGYTADSLWRRLPARGRQGAAALAAFWFLVAALYPYLLFTDAAAQRQRRWAEARPLPALYPTTWDEPPRFGLFGFPYQAGWRLVPELLPEEALPYASNEEEEITNWYMSQAPRTHCPNFNSFILAERVQDEIPYDPALLAGLYLQHEIEVAGHSSLQIYGRQPAAQPVVHEVQYGPWFTPQQIAPPDYGGQNRLDVEFEGRVRLLGYDLDSSQAYPGGRLQLTLYWQALTPFERNYQVFVHLFDGQMRAQDDGAPECAVNPTTRWEPGQIIPDPHLVDLPPDMPLGPVPMLAGMYDLLTGERLVVDGETADFLRLTEVQIRPPGE